MNKIREVSNRKSGYVLVEALVILMIVSFICVAINKIVTNNYLKSKVLETRQDIKTLTLTEEIGLLESIKYFNNSSDKNNNVSTDTNKYVIKIPNKYILSPEIDRLTIDINERVMIKERSNSKSYTEIDIKSIVVNEKSVINIYPKFCKTDYIVNYKKISK